MLDLNKKASNPVLEVLCRLSVKRMCSCPAMWVLKPLAWFFLIILSVGVLFPALSSAATVEVKVFHSQDKYPAGGTFPVLIKLLIAESWYIHGTKESGEDLVATVLSFPETPGLCVKDIRFPSPAQKKFSYSDEAIELFSGNILARATLEVSKEATLGNITLNGTLSFQACSSRNCMPPEKVRIPLEMTIAPPHTSVERLNQKMFAEQKGTTFKSLIPIGTGFWLTLLGIFLGGMALNLTPCIYPLIPITVSYFGGKSKEIQGRTFVHGTLYVSGLAITNSILGLTASLTGSMMGRLLQEPLVLMLIAGVLTFLALSFFDIWELHLPSSVNRLASKNFGGYFGTFFMGLTLGIVAAPCLGPFMLGLLTYVAQMGNPFLGFLYFFVLSIGMGLPLAVLAIFSGALKTLPMSGGWLTWIRRGLGWVLLGMAGYMLMPLISSPSGKSALIAVILVAAGLHLGWLDKTTAAVRLFPYIKKGLGVILIGIGAILFLVPSAHETDERVQWTSYSPFTLEEAARKNQPVILDFYADWCPPCKALDKKVFMDPEIVKLSRHFVNIRIDLTTEHPHQKKLKEKFDFKGAPTIIFINKRGVMEKDKIESFVDRDIILKRMMRLMKES